MTYEKTRIGLISPDKIANQINDMKDTLNTDEIQEVLFQTIKEIGIDKMQFRFIKYFNYD